MLLVKLLSRISIHFLRVKMSTRPKSEGLFLGRPTQIKCLFNTMVKEISGSMNIKINFAVTSSVGYGGMKFIDPFWKIYL